MKYNGPEHRNNVQLSDEVFEKIVNAAAQRAAPLAKELAKQELYIEVGKSTLSKVRWILLAGIAATSAWLASHGFFSK